MRRYPGITGIAFTRKVLWKFYWIPLYGDWRVYFSWAVGVGDFFTFAIKCWCIDQLSSRSRCAGWSHCLHVTGPSMLWWSPWQLGEVRAHTKQACPSCLGAVKKMKREMEELRCPWRVLTSYKNNGQSQRGEIWWGQRHQVSEMKAIIEYGEVVAEVIRAQ